MTDVAEHPAPAALIKLNRTDYGGFRAYTPADIVPTPFQGEGPGWLKFCGTLREPEADKPEEIDAPPLGRMPWLVDGFAETNACGWGR